MAFLETSAKDDVQVDAAFLKLASTIQAGAAARAGLTDVQREGYATDGGQQELGKSSASLITLGSPSLLEAGRRRKLLSCCT